MNKPLLKSKATATGIHVSISAVIFIVILYYIVVLWYPGHYFSTDGGWQGVRLMLFVDVILGPLLTFLIFNPAKSRREIVFDLSTIALVQVIALVWGLYAVNSQRPVAIMLSEETLQPMVAKSFTDYDFDIADLAEYSNEHPPIIYLLPPHTNEELAEQKARILAGRGLIVHFERYRSIKDHVNDAFDYRLDIEMEISDSDKLAKKLDKFLAAKDAKKEDYYYMPYFGRYGPAIMVFDKKGDLAGVIREAFKLHRVIPETKNQSKSSAKNKK